MITAATRSRRAPRWGVAALVLVAALVSGCSSSTGSDEDDTAYILATIKGTWQTVALGGTFVIALDVGAVDATTHTAPLTGSGTFQGNQFTVTGTLGGKTSIGTEELGIVKLEWTMPYQGSAKPFTFSGGLLDIQFSAFTQLSGTLATTGSSVGVILERR